MDKIKGIPNYIEKTMYLMRKQNFKCEIAKAYGSQAKTSEVHHRLHNTKPNQKRYPRFINSVFNLWLVNHKWHMEHPSAGRVPLVVADEIELMLTSNEKLNKWAQSPSERIPLDILPFVKVIFDLLSGEGLEAISAR